MKSFLCSSTEVFHTGFELASTTSRYRKFLGVNGNNKIYGQWAHRCSGELSLVALLSHLRGCFFLLPSNFSKWQGATNGML